MKYQHKLEYGNTIDGYSCAFRTITPHLYDDMNGESSMLHGYALSFCFRFTSNDQEVLESITKVESSTHNLIKQYLEEVFRNTVLVERDDPALEAFQALENAGACELRMNDAVGLHIFPKEVYEELRSVVQEQSQGKVVLYQVTITAMGHSSWSYADMDAFAGEPSTALVTT